MSTDLWPEITVVTKPRGMKQMLEEAGAGLAEKTNGLIRFVVEVDAYDHSDESDPQASSKTIDYEGLLYVPKVDYRYQLLRVVTGATPFPADILSAHARPARGIAD